MTLVDYLTRPVAYHPVLARLLGSVPAAVMLSQAVYWQQRIPRKRPPGCPGEGWWYHTAAEWFEETALTESSQITARKILRKTEFWHEQVAGMPCKLWFMVDFEALEYSLVNRQFPVSRGTSFRQIREQDGRFTGNMVPVTPPPLYSETTPETSPETTTGPELKACDHGGGPHADLGQEQHRHDDQDHHDAEIEDYVRLVVARDRPLKPGGYARGIRKRIDENGGLSSSDLQELKELRALEQQAVKAKEKAAAQEEQELMEQEIAARHKEIWQSYLSWPQTDRFALLENILPRLQEQLKGIVSKDKIDENFPPVRAEIILHLMAAEETPLP